MCEVGEGGGRYVLQSGHAGGQNNNLEMFSLNLHEKRNEIPKRDSLMSLFTSMAAVHVHVEQKGRLIFRADSYIPSQTASSP